MMRVGFAVSLVLGTAVTLAGTVAMFMKLPDAAIALTLGTGLIGSSAFAKAIQTKWENHYGVIDK
jgi:hypothetical protein